MAKTITAEKLTKLQAAGRKVKTTPLKPRRLDPLTKNIIMFSESVKAHNQIMVDLLKEALDREQVLISDKKKFDVTVTERDSMGQIKKVSIVEL